MSCFSQSLKEKKNKVVRVEGQILSLWFNYSSHFRDILLQLIQSFNSKVSELGSALVRNETLQVGSMSLSDASFLRYSVSLGCPWRRGRSRNRRKKWHDGKTLLRLFTNVLLILGFQLHDRRLCFFFVVVVVLFCFVLFGQTITAPRTSRESLVL